MRRAMLFLAAFVAAASMTTLPSRAVDAPFEGSLLRLSEVLGSLHFLRNLCGETSNQWRDEMQKMLDAEKPDQERREKFVASFNRGYRSFEGTYTKCTASATEAITRYMKEGETLTREVAGRYGN